jgi:hypothetical protein
MPDTLRGRIKENLAVGAAIGVLAILAALLAAFVDSRAAAFERSALPGPSATVVASSRVSDPGFSRVHSIRDASGTLYGVVFSARSREASAIFGAIFSPRGELRSLKLLGASSSRLPGPAADALEDIDGASAILDRAAKAAVAAAEEGS